MRIQFASPSSMRGNVFSYVISFIAAFLGMVWLSRYTSDSGHYFAFIVLTLIGCAVSAMLAFNDRMAMRAFWLLFGLGILGVAVANFYRVELSDIVQTENDAAGFFEKATMLKDPLWYEDPLWNHYYYRFATSVWIVAYQFMESFGFASDPYIGQMVNVVLMAVGGLFTVKAVTVIFGKDENAGRVGGNFLAAYGLVYLSGTILLRDVFGFVYFSALFYYWVSFVVRGRLGSFLVIVAMTVFGWNTLYALREGMEYLPFVFIGVYCIVLIYRKSGPFGAFLIGLISILVLMVVLRTQFAADRIFEKADQYAEMEKSSSSLGYNYLVNMPIYVRWATGFFYLLVFPVPFFSSLMIPTAYHLYKGMAGLWMIVVAPWLLSGSVAAIKRQSAVLSKEAMGGVLFSAVLFLANYLIVGLSTIENRHTIPIISAMIVVVVFGFRERHRSLKVIRFIWFGGLIAMYVLWILMKLR